MFDTKIVRIACCSSMIYSRILLPISRIRQLDADADDIFMDNQIDTYCNRFEEAEGMSMYSLHSPNNSYTPILNLSPDQYYALNMILNSTHNRFIIQGGPGSGKSSLLKTIQHYGNNLNILLTAATGLAAYLIGSGTVQPKLMLFKNNDSGIWYTGLFNGNNTETIKFTSTITSSLSV
eukprot:NODE_122_length_17689_cov_1.046219.p8 type:complete len:178 gc:universal NODE_122_length_17689_cov_1.046219:6823-6290(-)